jgi:hypothetical protein
VQAFAALETLGRTLFNMSDVVVSEPLSDASEGSCVIEELARHCEASRRINVQLHALYTDCVPLRIPCLERGSRGSALVTLQISDRIPNPKHRDFVKPKLLHSLLVETMEVCQHY